MASPASLPILSFVYDELPESSIRLLDIVEQENRANCLSLRLRTYRLCNAPAFNALSYVWGDDARSFRVPCWSDEPSSHATSYITVNSSLYRALPFLRAASPDRPIWIDAVCINQRSDGEKAKVVPMMGEYYSQAADVLIWLGPGGDGSALAIDVLKWLWFPEQRDGLQQMLCGPLTSQQLKLPQLTAISSALRGEVHIRDVAKDIARLGLPSAEHKLWSALRALYQREWFFRVWTFQEIMLAKNATVLCGDSAIPWTAFQQLGDRLGDTQLLWIGRPSGPDSFTPLRTLQNPHRGGEWFWLYLHGARDRRCRFQEDRIFGMLALAPQSIRAKIKVVYRSEDEDHYIQVYRAAAIVFLEEFPLETVLTAAPFRDRNERMPSWCPDWSVRTTSKAPPARFRTDPIHFALQSWSTDPLDQNILLVHGRQTDVVDVVINDYSYSWPNGISGVGGPADKMLQWLDRCEDLTQRTVASPDEAAVKDAYWQTLLSYSDTHNQGNFPPDPVRGLAAHRKRLAESRDSIPIAQTELTEEDLQALGPLLAYVGILWPGKVFFSTKGGTVGIADMGIAAGDSICLFFGACKHFVLGSLDHGTYSLKSVAYVHGMMGNVTAALNLRDLGMFPDGGVRTFRIR